MSPPTLQLEHHNAHLDEQADSEPKYLPSCHSFGCIGGFTSGLNPEPVNKKTRSTKDRVFKSHTKPENESPLLAAELKPELLKLLTNFIQACHTKIFAFKQVVLSLPTKFSQR